MASIAGFRGEQLTPGDAGYDEARTVFNAMVDKRPALIARCTDADDVAKALAHAKETGLPVAVLNGGHSVAGMSLNDGGVVIDVRPIDHVEVDGTAKTARAGAGITWSAFDRAAAEHGLAATGGRVSTTGITGLTIGGGSGWLERACGLACDNLIGLTMVTADGRTVHADERENPDLLWAHRGGGGNFGVITELEFRLHPMPPVVYGGLALYDPQHAPELLRAYRDLMDSGPEEIGVAVLFLTAPPEPFVPAEWHGRIAFGFGGIYYGAVEVGEQALKPLIEKSEPLANLFGPVPYADFQCMIDDPPGNRNYWTAEYLEDLPDEAIDDFCRYSEEMPPSFSQSLLVAWGGAVQRNAGNGPLANRDARYVLHPFGVWDDAALDETVIAWARRGREVFAPYATGGVYLNFIGDEGTDRVRAAFGDAYDRLVAIKTQWDPDNVFQGNQNIRPALAAA